VCDGESRADGAAEQVADQVGRRRASPQRAPFLGSLPGFAIFVTALVADAVKPTSAEAIAQLRALGLQPRQGAQGRHSPGQRARRAGARRHQRLHRGDWEAVGSSGLPPLLGGGCGDAGQREPTGQPLGGEASSRPTPTGGRFGHMLMTVGALSYLEVAPRDEPD
jgi:hypothetical protein